MLGDPVRETGGSAPTSVRWLRAGPTPPPPSWHWIPAARGGVRDTGLNDFHRIVETDTELKHFNRTLIHNELDHLNATLLRFSNFLCLLFILNPTFLPDFMISSLSFISIQLYAFLWTPTVFSTFFC